MSDFLGNIFTKGTQALLVAGKLIKIPVNEDWAGIAEISAYDATKGKVTLKKIWSQAVTPETFFAWAKYLGQSGVPAESEVVVGEYVVFYRVGVGNVNFSATPAGFQLHDSQSTTKASFVVFFF